MPASKLATLLHVGNIKIWSFFKWINLRSFLNVEDFLWLAYNWELIFLQWDATIWVSIAMHFRNGWKKKRLSLILITPFSSRISVQNFFYTIITTHYDTHYNFPLFKKYIPWKLNNFKELKFNHDQSVTTHKMFF